MMELRIEGPGRARWRTTPHRARRGASLAVALVALLATRVARADPEAPAREPLVGVGVRLGFLPPILTVVEAVVRPVPHVALAAFGMVVPRRFTLGGAVAFEMAEAGRATPYLQLAYAFYSASGSSWERSHVAYVTGGYLWKFTSGLDLQVGGGALFVLADELPPCTGFCIELKVPPILPTLDLAGHFRFL
jgi:hypothetical protein